MGPDEEMDTTPLAQPFFMIDKGKALGSEEEGKRDGEDSSVEEDEDPTCPVEEDKEEDDEVSVTRKASPKNGPVENRDGIKTNGNRNSESEESSEEEGMDEDARDQMTERSVNPHPVSAAT